MDTPTKLQVVENISTTEQCKKVLREAFPKLYEIFQTHNTMSFSVSSIVNLQERLKGQCIDTLANIFSEEANNKQRVDTLKGKNLLDVVDIQDIDSQVLQDVLNAEGNFQKYIPSESDCLGYISEETQNEMVATLKRIVENRITILVGPTGTGKTTKILTLAHCLNMPVYREVGGENRSYDSLLKSVVTRNTHGEKSVVILPNTVLKAAISGGIALLDEANVFTEDVQLAISQIIDDGEILVSVGNKIVRVPIHPHFYIVMTGNEGYEGSNDFPDPVVRRSRGKEYHGYLSLEAEIQTAYNGYCKEISQVLQNNNTKREDRLSYEEIEKMATLYHNIRSEVAKLPLQKAMTEGYVHYVDQFSLRILVNILVFADISENNNVAQLLSYFFINVPSEVQKIITKYTSRFPLLSFNTLETQDEILECFRGKGEDIIRELVDEETFIEIFGKNPLRNQLTTPETSVLDSVSNHAGVSGILDTPHLQVVGGENSTISWGEKHASGVKIFDPQQPEGHFPHDKYNENFADIQFTDILDSVHHVEGDPLLFVNALCKQYNALYRYLVFQEKSPTIVRYKKLITAQVNRENVYIVLGFEGNMLDVAYADLKNKKSYILHEDRQSTKMVVFTPNEDGKYMIHASNGDVIFLPDDSEIDTYKDQGYIRCSKENKESELQRKIENRIKKLMLHADENNTVPEENLRTFTRNVYPVIEGKDIAQSANIESIGRHIKYIEKGMEEQLNVALETNKAGLNLLCMGESGTGKSSLAKALCIMRKTPYTFTQCNDRSKESTMLKKTVMVKGNVHEVSLPLLYAYEFGWPHELRELNTVMPDDYAFLNLLFDRNGSIVVDGRVIKRHKFFMPIITINPMDELHPGVRPMLSSLMNRCVKLNITYPKQNQEVQVLMATIDNENSALSKELVNESAKIKNIVTMLVKANNFVRTQLQNFMKQKRIREELQKVKMSTDQLQSLVTSADTIEALKHNIYAHFYPESRTESEKKLLDQCNVTQALSTIFVDMNT